MGYGFKHGAAGGASTALNFKVVGGTSRPSAPGENTIWVNGEGITSWVLSPVEPQAAEGLAWISIGGASEYAFNALKKNALMVFPISAKVYTGGAWANAEAEIYQNGEWNNFSVTWDGYYFKDGDQYESVTGGWTTDGWNNQATANAGNGILYVESPNQLYAARIGTASPIDFSGISKLYVDSPTGQGDNFFPGYLLVCTEKQDYTNVAQITISTAGTTSINVSDLNGSYYLLLRTLGGQTGNGVGSASIRAIWAE